MLDMTMATRFLPGTNRRGDAAGGNWTFLLPSLELRRVLCSRIAAGRHPADVVASGPAGDRVRPERGGNAEGRRDGRSMRIGQCRGGLGADRRRIPLPQRPLRPGGGRRPGGLPQGAKRGGLPGGAAPAAAPSGLLYFELDGWSDRWFCAPVAEDLGNAFGGAMPLWITPMIGQQMQSAVPAHDRRSIAYFRRHAMAVPSSHRRSLQWVERLLTAHSPLGRFDRRRGVLLGRDADNLATDPPEYLCASGAAIGDRPAAASVGHVGPGEVSVAQGDLLPLRAFLAVAAVRRQTRRASRS